jgi:hypothetical protein
MLQAMVIVPVLGILTPVLFFLFALCWASIFGDVPWGRWTVVGTAGDHMAVGDPSFRIEDYDAVVRWVGGRDGAWEVYFTHKITGHRTCLRWVNGGLVYSFIEIDCPTVAVRPSG